MYRRMRRNAGAYFWRSKARAAPHNLYTSSAQIAGFLAAHAVAIGVFEPPDRRMGSDVDDAVVPDQRVLADNGGRANNSAA